MGRLSSLRRYTTSPFTTHAYRCSSRLGRQLKFISTQLQLLRLKVCDSCLLASDVLCDIRQQTLSVVHVGVSLSLQVALIDQDGRLFLIVFDVFNR
jgi:hypothetical protein